MNIVTRWLAACCLAVPVAVLAQTPVPKDPLATPGVDKRQANQEARIQQGAQSGQLTPKEASKLERGQAHVQKMEDKAKADGTVTAKERKRLQHAQDQQSRKIYREKHDPQRDLDHDGKNDRKARRTK